MLLWRRLIIKRQTIKSHKDYIKIYKVAYKVIKFIEETKKTREWSIQHEEKRFAELKIQRDIFQGDALLSLLLVIVIMPLNHILRKCTGGYKLTKSHEKINYLMYIKLFAKSEKELVTRVQAVRIYTQDLGMEFGIEKSAILIMRSRIRQMTEGIKLPNQHTEKRKLTSSW